MANKYSMNLSDVQMKVLDELELLNDAYISTFTELGNVINFFSEEINNVIKIFLKENPTWHKYSSENYNLKYFPFTYTEDSVLSSEFVVEGYIQCIKKISQKEKIKEVNWFGIWWAFQYDKNRKADKYFNFAILRPGKYGPPILSIDEYETLLKKLKNIKHDYILEHPMNGDKDEKIELIISLDNRDQLMDLYKFYKDDLVKFFLTKIKD